ncbi:hypothetical protein PGIGA_G00118270 [Pangasianodon gigas]|uniref:Uncharacterized protein n=1 Tax=Pangasianodon gigas TaxID=30993 RepID=A0ACC5XFG0_PANGG|nr:hypothetical protein [Pangasianodon gigas]
MMIVAGDNFLGKYEGMEQYSKPYSITPHPLYNKSTNNADIMLIKLRAPIKLNRYVSLAPLPKQNTGVLPGRLCQVYGWSPTRQGRGVSPLTLHSVALPITSTAKCNSSRSFNGSITSNMICAGYTTGGKDACKVSGFKGLRSAWALKCLFFWSCSFNLRRLDMSYNHKDILPSDCDEENWRSLSFYSRSDVLV